MKKLSEQHFDKSAISFFDSFGNLEWRLSSFSYSQWFDFCYSLLIATINLLRRLSMKDCLHICLQLNNSICQIIDIFVKHNYGIMNAEFYSVLFFRLHSLVKQQITVGATFQSRLVYVHALHIFSALLHTIDLSEQVVQQFPQEFYELIYYILMDESFHLSYPHIRQRILPIAEKFDKDNFQVFLKSDEVCRSFTAACDLLHLDETNNENFLKCVKLGEDALLGLPYHLNFEVIKRFVNVCSKIWSKKSSFDLPNRNYSIDVLMKFLTNEQAEIRSGVYSSIAMIVASRLSVEETVKTAKDKKKPTHAVRFDEMEFICNGRVLLEIVVRGMNDLATKVSDHSRLILLHLLQSKFIVDEEFWKKIISQISNLLPFLQCYANKIDPLGQCILSLTSDTDTERENLLTINQRLQTSLRYLFFKDKDVRKNGYRQCVGHIVTNSRVRLDDFYQFYPAEKLDDLFITAQPIHREEHGISENVNIESFLRVYTIFTDRTKIDASVRKSALEQIGNMLTDPSLHSTFMSHAGLDRILEELRVNVKRDDLVCSTDLNSTIPGCTKVLRLLIEWNRKLQRQLSLDNDFLKLIFKSGVCCHNDPSIVSNCAEILIFLLFDRNVHKMNQDEETQSATFSVDSLIAKNFKIPSRMKIDNSSSSIRAISSRPDPLREKIVEEKFRFFWNVLWNGSIDEFDARLDETHCRSFDQNDFTKILQLNENDRKIFSFTFARRTIRFELNCLNESENHESMVESLDALRSLLLVVTHENVHLIDFNQLSTILDRFFQIVPNSAQDEKLLQNIFEFLEQISYGFHVSTRQNDENFVLWLKNLLLGPFGTLLEANKDFVEMRQTKRDLLKKFFRFLSSFFAHRSVSSEFFTEKFFSNVLTYVKQSKTHTFSKLTLISAAIELLQQITAKPKWFLIFNADFLQDLLQLLIAVIETFHQGRQEASSSFMAHGLIRATSQTVLNTILALKSTMSNVNRRQETTILQEWLETRRPSFQWLRYLCFYNDLEIRTSAYSIVALLVTERSGREILFSNEHRFEENQLVSILFDEDESSLVKEQVSNILINLTFSCLDDHVKLSTNNTGVAFSNLLTALNDCDFMDRIGSSIFSNLYPFVALDLDALRVNQTNASPVSPLLVGNLCSLLFNLHLAGFHQESPELIKLLLSFLDVRPLESKMNKTVTSKEYRVFMENMFFMNTKIGQYLRAVFESNAELLNKSIINENLVQIISFLAFFPEENFDKSEEFWRTKVELGHLLVEILLGPSSSVHSEINRNIVENSASLFKILSLPLAQLINGPSSAAASILFHLLSISIAQSSLDKEKLIWRNFFDQNPEEQGSKIFEKLLIIYEDRLNTEANDSLKLTVSNLIKSLLNISFTAKRSAIEKGFIESQIDHLKRVQTKLTLFSLQSDKCVSKDEVLLDECLQVLAILNNLALDFPQAKEILSTAGLVPFLHQLWCWAIVDIQLLNMILLLLTTLTAKHRKACLSVCSTVLPSSASFVVQTPDQQRPLSNLFSYVLRLISKSSISSANATNPSSNKNQTIEMSFDVILNCSMEIEGRSLIYKSNFYQTFVDHFERVSRDVHRFDRRFLEVMINITFFPDGQTSVLKNSQIFLIAVRLAQNSSPVAIQRQALFILRNLAFSSTQKARIVGEARFVPTIMSHIVSKTSDNLYLALTALWALVVDAQKSKVAVRSNNVLPILYDVKTQQKNKENLLCYHAVSNIIQLLTED